jgi:hypothetical protein
VGAFILGKPVVEVGDGTDARGGLLIDKPDEAIVWPSGAAIDAASEVWPARSACRL